MGEEDSQLHSAKLERDEWRDTQVEASPDWVACEEPLELRVGGVPLAVVMRTPGHDIELARGFMLSEGIVSRAEEIESVRHCDTVDDPRYEDNVVQIRLSPELDFNPASLRRNVYTASSCGICGRTSLERALKVAPPIEEDALSVPVSLLYGLPERMRGHQDAFERTGGLHAAALFDQRGELLVLREDVGRHNAVDKVLGWRQIHRREELQILMVSGRVSFEIVQKALAGRIPVIAAVSAPSSLAVELAEAGGITLAAFVRDRRLCVYSQRGRVRRG